MVDKASVSVVDVMKTDVFTCRASDRLDSVREVMSKRRFRHVPVVADDGRIIGILCDRDIRTASFGTKKHGPSLGELMVANIPVSEIMVTEPVTVSPDTHVAAALDIMKEKRISCLPVVAGEELMGIVTGADFLALLRRLFDS